MKILKNVLIGLAVVIVIALIGIYFLPSHYKIINSIEIERPVDVVYAQVADYGKWNDWSPWVEMEPDAKITIEGEPGTVGHKMTWEGKKLGLGSITIDAVNANAGIASDLEFKKPMEATSRDFWKFESMGNKTKATWTSSGDLSYPFGRVFGLNMDKMVGDPQRHGLDNLKKLCESIEVAPMTAASDSTVIPVQ